MAPIQILKEQKAALERLLEGLRDPAGGQIRAILACTFTFDRAYWERILDEIRDTAPGRSDCLARIPLDVVCDRRHYKGHGPGYNVTRWHGPGLFHPKLLMILRDDEVLRVEGSLNLTSAGWSKNREIAIVERSEAKRLPIDLHRLLKALPGVPAAVRILEETGVEKGASRCATLTSVRKSIGPRFLYGACASEVHIVAPFFDRTSMEEHPIDREWLAYLKGRLGAVDCHLYLPQADGPHSVFGSKKTFAVLEEPGCKVLIHPVPPDRGNLHAKVLMLRHGHGQSKARILVGSPNMTRRALLDTSPSKNIELARRLAVRWKDAERLLAPLRSKGFELDATRFVPFPPINVSSWDPLKRASYDRYTSELTVEWRDAAARDETDIDHDRLPVVPDVSGRVRRFALSASDRSLRCRRRGHPGVESYCPIDVPYEDTATVGETSEGLMSLQDWVRLLGSESGAGQPGRHQATGPATPDGSDETREFDVSEDVLDLYQRMRWAQSQLKCEDDPRLRAAQRRRLEKIYEAHNPAEKKISDRDRVWRFWVRAEIVVALRRAGRGSGRRAESLLAGRLGRRMRSAHLPRNVRADARRLVGALR